MVFLGDRLVLKGFKIVCKNFGKIGLRICWILIVFCWMIVVVFMVDYFLLFLNVDINELFIKRNILGGGIDVDINWCLLFY